MRVQRRNVCHITMVLAVVLPFLPGCDVLFREGIVVPGMVVVPEGWFVRGCTTDQVDCKNDEVPAKRVWVSRFWIGRTEVTIDEYAKCFVDGPCTEPGAGGACNWGYDNRGYHPVNCVTHTQAVIYCDWLGGRLPTEAEWEKAARGTSGLSFPWGNAAATCELAVVTGDGAACNSQTTYEVNSVPAGASPYDAKDMAGNVAEWVLDYYDFDYYTSSDDWDPKGPKAGTVRLLRGGSFISGASSALTYRRLHVEEVDEAGRGIRCVYPEP